MTSEFMTADELATRWHVTIRTLARWRAESTGPKWVKIEGRVLYRLAAIEAHERDNTRKDT